MNKYGNVQDVSMRQGACSPGHISKKPQPAPKVRGKVVRAEVVCGDFMGTVRAWFPDFESQIRLTTQGRWPTEYALESGYGMGGKE